MFCNQCQETAKNTGCTVKGVCGKTEEVANLQDLLVYLCKGLSYATTEARKSGIDTREEGRFITKSLFMTITNANFDKEDILNAIRKAIQFRDRLKKQLNAEFDQDAVLWNASSGVEFEEKSKTTGINDADSNEDIRALKQYVIYGLKGMSAYAEHACNLGFEDDTIYDFIEQALVMTTQEQDLNSMVGWVLRTGEFGVKVMALLDKANTSVYGHPEITKVNTGVRKNPGNPCKRSRSERPGATPYPERRKRNRHLYPF